MHALSCLMLTLPWANQVFFCLGFFPFYRRGCMHACSVTQSCLTLCDPRDCSLPGSSIHEISQARILEWIAISISWGSSWPRDWTQVSHLAGRLFTVWAIRESSKEKVCFLWLKRKKVLANLYNSILMNFQLFLSPDNNYLSHIYPN